MIYYQSKRTATLWFGAVISLSCSIFTCYMVFNMSIEKDLIDYGSLLKMRIWQIIFLVLGNVMTLAFCWLSNRYVLCIEFSNEQYLRIKTWSLFRFSVTHIFNLSDFANNDIQMKDGTTILPFAPIVIAPWDGITLANGKKLLVDAQGEFPQGYDAYWALINAKLFHNKRRKK